MSNIITLSTPKEYLSAGIVVKRIGYIYYVLQFPAPGYSYAPSALDTHPFNLLDGKGSSLRLEGKDHIIELQDRGEVASTFNNAGFVGYPKTFSSLREYLCDNLILIPNGIGLVHKLNRAPIQVKLSGSGKELDFTGIKNGYLAYNISTNEYERELNNPVNTDLIEVSRTRFKNEKLAARSSLYSPIAPVDVDLSMAVINKEKEFDHVDFSMGVVWINLLIAGSQIHTWDYSPVSDMKTIATYKALESNLPESIVNELYTSLENLWQLK